MPRLWLGSKYTLGAYTELSIKCLSYVLANPPFTPLPVGPLLPINAPNGSMQLNMGIEYDNPYARQGFGRVAPAECHISYGSTVEVQFVGANPRNSLWLARDPAVIEKQTSNGEWHM